MTWRPAGPDALAGEIAQRVAAHDGLVRVAVDGAPATEPGRLAADLLEPLRLLGRSAVHVDCATFLRDASVRFESGRQDVESYSEWVDYAGLQREVLQRAERHHDYLPSLRDPNTNRATRAAREALSENAVIIVSGPFLLGRNLAFDWTVHLSMSAAALDRRTPPDRSWTLPAYAEYDARVRPMEIAHLAVKLDDPRHPALRGNSD